MVEQLYDKVLSECLERYERNEPVDKKDMDVFKKIKEETSPNFSLIEEWEKETNAHVHKLSVFPNQIQNTRDNMELLLLHSYYIDVKRKRFMELYHSVDFVLKQIRQDISGT
nr:DUF1798 family protein [Salirhabdus salicampi]